MTEFLSVKHFFILFLMCYLYYITFLVICRAMVGCAEEPPGGRLQPSRGNVTLFKPQARCLGATVRQARHDLCPAIQHKENVTKKASSVTRFWREKFNHVPVLFIILNPNFIILFASDNHLPQFLSLLSYPVTKYHWLQSGMFHMQSRYYGSLWQLAHRQIICK